MPEPVIVTRFMAFLTLTYANLPVSAGVQMTPSPLEREGQQGSLWAQFGHRNSLWLCSTPHWLPISSPCSVPCPSWEINKASSRSSSSRDGETRDPWFLGLCAFSYLWLHPTPAQQALCSADHPISHRPPVPAPSWTCWVTWVNYCLPPCLSFSPLLYFLRY